MSNDALEASSRVGGVNVQLSIKAYILAQKCCHVSGGVSVLKGAAGSEEVAELANAVSALQTRLVLLGGYFAGVIKVEDGLISVATEEAYMDSASQFLETIEGFMGASK